jgi:cysteine synthase
MDPKTKLVVPLDDNMETSVMAVIASLGANLHKVPRLGEMVEAAVG